MPAGTKVDEVYQALLKKGYSKEKAATIAQAQTGEALATGRPIKAANTAEASEPSSPRSPRDRRGPEYALAAANEPVEDLTSPSSTRVTPSPGQQVLKELQRDKVRRQAAAKPIDPLPDPVMAANAEPVPTEPLAPANQQSGAAVEPSPVIPTVSQPYGPAAQRHVDRLVRIGHTPESARAEADKVFGGKTPEEIEEKVRKFENWPDSYHAPGAFSKGAGHDRTAKKEFQQHRAWGSRRR